MLSPFGVCSLRFFFLWRKAAYEMRSSDWSSDVCSSDLKRRLSAGYCQILAALDQRPTGLIRPFRHERERNILPLPFCFPPLGPLGGYMKKFSPSGRLIGAPLLGNSLQIRSATGKEQVCAIGSISVGDCTLKKKKKSQTTIIH